MGSTQPAEQAPAGSPHPLPLPPSHAHRRLPSGHSDMLASPSGVGAHGQSMASALRPVEPATLTVTPAAEEAPPSPTPSPMAPIDEPPPATLVSAVPTLKPSADQQAASGMVSVKSKAAPSWRDWHRHLPQWAQTLFQRTAHFMDGPIVLLIIAIATLVTIFLADIQGQTDATRPKGTRGKTTCQPQDAHVGPFRCRLSPSLL